MSVSLDVNVYDNKFFAAVEIRTPPQTPPTKHYCNHSFLKTVSEFDKNPVNGSCYPEYKQVSVIDLCGSISSAIASGCAFKEMPIDIHVWNSDGRSFRGDINTVCDNVPVPVGSACTTEKIYPYLPPTPHYVVIPLISSNSFPNNMYGVSTEQLIDWFSGMVRGNHHYVILISDDFWNHVASTVRTPTMTATNEWPATLFAEVQHALSGGRPTIAEVQNALSGPTIEYIGTTAKTKTRPANASIMVANYICGPPVTVPSVQDYAITMSFSEGRVVCAEVVSDVVLSPSSKPSTLYTNTNGSVRVGSDAIHVHAIASQTLKFNICGIIIGDGKWSQQITINNDFAIKAAFHETGFDALLMDGLNIVKMLQHDDTMDVKDPRMKDVWEFNGVVSYSNIDKHRGLVQMLRSIICGYLTTMYEGNCLAPPSLHRRRQVRRNVSAHPLKMKLDGISETDSVW